MPNITKTNSFDDHNRPASTTQGSIKWLGHLVGLIKNNCHPVSWMINLLAYCLFPLARNCAFNSSSLKYKWQTQSKLINASRETLKELGGIELNLPTKNGVLSAIYLDSEKCFDILKSKGAVVGRIIIGGPQIGHHQDVLWIPSGKPELRELIKRMGLDLHKDGDRKYIPIGCPAHFVSSRTLNVGTVIYSPGSGHLFERRRKTIGSFLIGQRMNFFAFNYTGTGKSTGNLTEESTYTDLETAYKYLKSLGTKDNKILSYGHCGGAGPATHLVKEHPEINLLTDRTFTDIGKFAALRARTVMHLPKKLHILTDWIEPVMKRCFNYTNNENIKCCRGHVGVIGATNDEMIPKEDIDQLFHNAISAKTKTRMTFNTAHDPDLVVDEDSRRQLGAFLARADLNGQENQD